MSDWLWIVFAAVAFFTPAVYIVVKAEQDRRAEDRADAVEQAERLCNQREDS